MRPPEEVANQLITGWTGTLEKAYGLDPCPAIKISQESGRYDELVAIIAADRKEAVAEFAREACELFRTARWAKGVDAHAKWAAVAIIDLAREKGIDLP